MLEGDSHKNCSDRPEEIDVRRKYDFIKSGVPRFHYKDSMGLQFINQQTPVILTGADLVQSANKWDLKYLEEHLGAGPIAVFCHKAEKENSNCSCQNVRNRRKHSSKEDEPRKSFTNTRLNLFKYFDDKKLQTLQDKSSFQQEIVREEMSFQEFLQKYHGDRSKERVYLQQPLNNTVGRQIAADFVGFNWTWAMERQKDWGWGPLTSNLLLIGQKGNVTPCHYDEQQNLFCQIQGSKRFLLFSPDNFRCLYPYPVHHPHDRQSQVDLDYPDLKRYPNFERAHGVEAVLEPGEILYIPMYWWHHVINVEDTIAINFWHKAGTNSSIEYPLQSRQKVAMIRNVEKMLLEALQDQKELSNVLHWMVDGRF